MKRIEYFDYQKVAREMGMSDTILKKIECEVKKEFPSDKMMYELHVLRAVRSKYWKKSCQARGKGKLSPRIKRIRLA